MDYKDYYESIIGWVWMHSEDGVEYFKNMYNAGLPMGEIIRQLRVSGMSDRSIAKILRNAGKELNNDFSDAIAEYLKLDESIVRSLQNARNAFCTGTCAGCQYFKLCSEMTDKIIELESRIVNNDNQ